MPTKNNDNSSNNECDYGKAGLYGLCGAILLLTGVRGALLDTGLGNLAEFLLGMLAGAAVMTGAWVIVRGLLWLLRRVPASFAIGIAAALLATWFFDTWSMSELSQALLDTDAWGWPFDQPTGLDLPSVFVLTLTAGLFAATVNAARAGSLPEHTGLFALTGASVAASIAIVVALSSVGHDPYDTDFSNFIDAGEVPALPGDPAAAGEYEIEYFTYGAGDNPRRPEFGARRRLESRTVDASALLPEWKGLKSRMRESYWGFDLKDAPLNALVWTPEGDGDYPLVLIVHGNHAMEDYSDPGYRYLGELLASRGYIAVSVDQNYINGSWSGDFRGKEMPARAWLLLEHLSLWRDWSQDPEHELGRRVDMTRISLIGHSRGGEAVSIAYAYNDLPHYPDDATVSFNYAFDIRSLVAIAQVDQRYHRRVELEDVSFLALQGSYDSDEPAYHGMRQFHRIRLTGNSFHFKAGIYIHGANHGQFNSGWGNTDYSPPGSWLLNLAPLIPAADQERIAQVYISAFVEATLDGDLRWLPIFRDPRVAAGLLPDHPYVNQYSDSTFVPIATFEEDLDVRSATMQGVRVESSGLSLWREEELTHRDERKQGSSAVVLGWRAEDRPVYELTLPDGALESISADDFFSLSVSGSTESVPDDTDHDEVDDADNGEDEPVAPGFDVAVRLRDGRECLMSASSVATITPPLRVRYLKNEAENMRRYNDEWEPVLQYLEFPLADLACGAAPSAITTIRFEMDSSTEGVMILDDIGIRRHSGNER